jgi:hypothetical protein
MAASAALVPDDKWNTDESSKDEMIEVTSTTVQHKESKRRSLFRSLSSQKTTTQASRRNSSVGPSPKAPAPPVADKVIRANSMTYESTQTHIAYYAQPPIPVPEKYVFCSDVVRGEQWKLIMSPAQSSVVHVITEDLMELRHVLVRSEEATESHGGADPRTNDNLVGKDDHNVRVNLEELQRYKHGATPG